MSTFLLLEVYVMSFLILIGIVYNRKYSIDLQVNNIVFSCLLYAVLASITMAIIDSILLIVAKKPCLLLSKVTYALNYCTEEIACYLWFLYIFCEGCGASKRMFRGRTYLYYSIPAAIGCVLSILSIFFNIIFSINADLHSVQHEKLFIIHVIILYGYFISAATYKQIMLLKEKRSSSGKYNILMEQIFILLPFTSGVLYLLLPKVPTLWPFVTLTLLMVYIDGQSRQISTDSLTKLNNRRHFDQYLFNSFLEERQPNQFLFLFMLDIDLFKSINDNYGHIEGDCALMATAKIFRSVCSDRTINIFLARTGGDEFSIILKANQENQAELLKQKLQDSFDNWNKTEQKPYKINVSIGYALATAGMQPSDLIKQADKNLYEEKKLHHAQR